MIDQEDKNVYGYTIPGADSLPKKRSHETYQTGQFVNQNVFDNENVTFLGNDISMQIYQQQLDIDRFILHHTEKVKYEIESTRRTNSMRLMIAAEEQITKKLRMKDNEIVKISKLNYVLEEKVKTLIVENQIWKQMAETNEATANVLRRNLQRILTDIQQQNQNQNQNLNEDVESCCGSTNNNNKDEGIDVNSGNNGCKNCGKKESCVLLLPCRHLCICSVCESIIKFCPICKCLKNATVQVNMT